MEIVITAVGPDNVGLADPIIHDLTGRGANIAEIQMYDHDEAAVFAMLCRVQVDPKWLDPIRKTMATIGGEKSLEIRVWSPDERRERPRLAICVTYLEEAPRAVLEGIRSGQIHAEAAVMIGNRRKCEGLAREFDVPWEYIGKDDGSADEEKMVQLFDRYQVDYIRLGTLHANFAARYVLEVCRREDHQFAPWSIAKLSWLASLSHSLFVPDVILWCDLSFHCAGARCGQPDYSSDNVFRCTRDQVGRDYRDGQIEERAQVLSRGRSSCGCRGS